MNDATVTAREPRTKAGERGGRVPPGIKGRYRLLLRVFLLLLIFFVGVGQVSLNRDGGSQVSLEQPVFRWRAFPRTGLAFSVGGKLENLVLPFLILWAAGAIMDRELRPKRTPLTLPLLSFLCLAILAYLFSPFREESWRDGLRELLLGGGFFFAAAAILASERQRKAALAVLFLSAGITALGGLHLFSRGIYFPDTPQRIWLSFMHPNTTGSVMLLLIPIGIALATGGISRGLRILCGSVTVILVAAMVLTFSRTAWIGLLVALGVLVMHWRHRLYLLGGLALLGTLLVLGVNFGPQSYLQNRVKSLYTFARDPNIEKRLIYWQGVVRMIRDRPVLGYGPGYRVFREAYEGRFKEVETDEDPVHAHNLYLSLGSGVGIPGLVIFFWLLGEAFPLLRLLSTRSAIPLDRFYGRGLTAGLAGFLVGGMADNPFFSFRVMLIFWLLLALAVAGGCRLLGLVKGRRVG